MKNILIALLICLAGSLQAAVFTSKDSQFTIDLPSGWAQARTPAAGAVLSVVKGSARIDIKPVPECNSETCIEQKTQADLVSVKNKKMQVVGNTFTGEEIKRIDFSSGEPFFYINFFTSKNDFSSGYFLIGKTAYSILAKDLSYAQTDLIFSLISPVQSIPALEMDLSDRRAYDIEALPDVSSQPIMAVQPVQKKLPTTCIFRRKFRRSLRRRPKRPRAGGCTPWLRAICPLISNSWGMGLTPWWLCSFCMFCCRRGRWWSEASSSRRSRKPRSTPIRLTRLNSAVSMAPPR